MSKRRVIRQILPLSTGFPVALFSWLRLQPWLQLQHGGESIRIDLHGIVRANEDRRPPFQSAAGTLLDAGAAVDTATTR
jgi:hypothetical protein